MKHVFVDTLEKETAVLSLRQTYCDSLYIEKRAVLHAIVSNGEQGFFNSLADPTRADNLTRRGNMKVECIKIV